MTNLNNQSIENTEIVLIQLRKYDTKVELGNEVDLVEGLSEFGSYTIICDAISEQADNYTPIYYNDIWENVRKIKSYVEEALLQGLVSMDSETTLDEIFQTGYYNYYSIVAYDNLETFLFNQIANIINEGIKAHNIVELDIDAIESDIESNNIDNNDTFEAIESYAKGLFQQIKDGEFSVE